VTITTGASIPFFTMRFIFNMIVSINALKVLRNKTKDIRIKERKKCEREFER